MKKVLFIVDSIDQNSMIDIKRLFAGRLELFFVVEDNAPSMTTSSQDWEAIVFCCWKPNGRTLSTVENVLRTFFGYAIACNQNSFVRKMLAAMKCQYECHPSDLPSLIESLLFS